MSQAPPLSAGTGSSGSGGVPILTVDDLEVRFETHNGSIQAVRGVSFSLHEGEILGIVGETGSGKSVSCKALTRLLPPSAHISGSIHYRDVSLTSYSNAGLRQYRGNGISMIFQDPQSCLNPIKSIYSHLREVLIKNGKTGDLKKAAKVRLKSVHIKSPGKRLKDYPFQFSGGMAQRVQIAMALTGSPDILIADEPTTALDVTIQARILNELRHLSRKDKLGVLLITHDLAVVAEICDRVAVMYHGRFVEIGDTADVLTRARHPYTRALLASVPALEGQCGNLMSIIGESLPAEEEIDGCDFADRCSQVQEKCRKSLPPMTLDGSRQFRCYYPPSSNDEKVLQALVDERHFTGLPILSVENLVCRFQVRGVTGHKKDFNAVDDVSFIIRKGEIFGIVGESGSGKSTLAKCLIGLKRPHSGHVLFKDVLMDDQRWMAREYATRVQYVFQDPLGALDPRMSILNQVAEPLLIHTNLSKVQREERATAMLRYCGLNSSFHGRKPYNLSGGQRQRAVLARALVIEPELLICDEPVSAMDVSVQAQILNLLKSLVLDKDVTVLLISHDLSVVNNMCDRVGVMFAGQFVETGPMERLFQKPEHPYTQLLMDSIPRMPSFQIGNKQALRRKDAKKEELMPTGIGCPFSQRCPKSLDICRTKRPDLTYQRGSHEIACHAL